MLRPAFSSLSLACKCFFLHRCSLYSTCPCLLVSSLYVHLTCLMHGLYAQARLVSLSLASGCFVLPPCSLNSTYLCLLISRKWVFSPSSMFYILRSPSPSLSLGSGCFVLPPCLLYSTHPFYFISSLYVHLSCLILGLYTETSICFFVSRQWVFCPLSMSYILKDTFVSLSPECGCFVLPPCSTYSDLHLFLCL